MTKISIWELSQEAKEKKLIRNCYEHGGLIVSTTFKKGKKGMWTRVHKWVKTKYFVLWETFDKEFPTYADHLKEIGEFIDSPDFERDKKLVKSILKEIGK